MLRPQPDEIPPTHSTGITRKFQQVSRDTNTSPYSSELSEERMMLSTLPLFPCNYHRKKTCSCWLFIFLLTDDLGKCACASLAYFEMKDAVQKFRPCLPVCFIEGRAERKIEKRHLQCHSLLKETLSVNNAISLRADYLWCVALAPSCAPVTYQSRSLKLHGLQRGHIRETCSLICLSTPVRTIYCVFPC